MISLKLDISVKFRAFLITFGNWSDSYVFQLPKEVGLLVEGAKLSGRVLTVIDRSGVKINISIL